MVGYIFLQLAGEAPYCFAHSPVRLFRVHGIELPYEPTLQSAVESTALPLSPAEDSALPSCVPKLHPSGPFLN